MATSSQLPILDANKSSARRISRRQWVERTLSGVAAGLAFPSLTASHPIHKHLLSASTLDLAEAQAANANWKPEFLGAHQVESLAAVAERIVPGSFRADSARFIDTLLSVDTHENQQRFLTSLAAMEGEAQKRYGHPLKDLAENQQNEILAAGDGEGRSRAGPAASRRKTRCETTLRI